MLESLLSIMEYKKWFRATDLPFNIHHRLKAQVMLIELKPWVAQILNKKKKPRAIAKERKRAISSCFEERNSKTIDPRFGIHKIQHFTFEKTELLLLGSHQ